MYLSIIFVIGFVGFSSKLFVTNINPTGHTLRELRNPSFPQDGVSSLRMNVGMYVDAAIGSAKSSGEVMLTEEESAL